MRTQPTATATTRGPRCGHSACRQHWIDTGSRLCVQEPSCAGCADEEPDPSMHEPDCWYREKHGGPPCAP